MAQLPQKQVHKRSAPRKAAVPLRGMSSTQNPRQSAVTRSAQSSNTQFFLKIAAGLVALVLLALVVDFAVNYGRAYEGVHVGSVDVSGMDAAQIEQAVNDAYGYFNDGNAVVYASQDAINAVQDKASQEQDRALAEQLAVEEAAQNQQAWPVSAASLEAHVPAAELAQRALNIGRSEGGVGARMHALFSGDTVSVYGAYNESLLQTFADSISEVIGTMRNDWGVSVSNGQAVVTDGNDGVMVDAATLQAKLDDAYFNGGDATNIVAELSQAPVRITQESAQSFCDALNAALGRNVSFSYQGESLTLNAETLGSWIAVSAGEIEGAYALRASIDASIAKSELAEKLLGLSSDSAVHISFDNSDKSNVMVNTSGEDKMPDSSPALATLNEQLFGSDGLISGNLDEISIDVNETDMPSSLAFNEALEAGLIGQVASYTTQFTTGSGTENRNHNIALVSQLLNNSVCAGGQVWSYNTTTGNCDESKGFLGAGAIVGDEYVDSIGGGICQVATTVFNAVYDAGYPVKERHNHSLYISSYPQGRDAAVDYPDLDFRWENDTENDVLVVLDCGEGEVTCILYGINPEYQVTSEVGNWQEGEAYTTKTKVDDSLSPGVSYIKTSGTDGRSITVVRTVRDKDGNILHEDAFQSVYNPKNEVIVKGPDS